MKVESGIEQERGGEKVVVVVGIRKKKRGDLEKRFAFRNNEMKEREREKGKDGGSGGVQKERCRGGGDAERKKEESDKRK